MKLPLDDELKIKIDLIFVMANGSITEYHVKHKKCDYKER